MPNLLHKFIKLPRRPSLRPEVIDILELRGADSLRGLLASTTDGYSGTGRNTQIDLGDVKVQRSDIENWLAWKADIEAMWVKAGVIFAAAAAIFSLLGLLCKR